MASLGAGHLGSALRETVFEVYSGFQTTGNSFPISTTTMQIYLKVNTRGAPTPPAVTRYRPHFRAWCIKNRQGALRNDLEAPGAEE